MPADCVGKGAVALASSGRPAAGPAQVADPGAGTDPIGDERQGGSWGPQCYVQARVERLLAARAAAVTVQCIERGKPFRDSASASLAVNKELARVVRQAVVPGHLPLILAGSCDICMGVLAGFHHARCGAVWIGAHGNFNTPESTVSGFFAGMSLAVITGHCYRYLWAQIGDSAPIPEAATLLLGVRDLDPAEREHLRCSAIQAVPWQEGKPKQAYRLPSTPWRSGCRRSICISTLMP
jgi:arginase